MSSWAAPIWTRESLEWVGCGIHIVDLQDVGYPGKPKPNLARGLAHSSSAESGHKGKWPPELWVVSNSKFGGGHPP
jgi:hypothetical protein